MSKKIDVMKLRVGDEVLNLPPGEKRATRWRVVSLVEWAGGRRATVSLRLLARKVDGTDVEVRHPRRVRWSRNDKTMRLARSELTASWWSLG